MPNASCANTDKRASPSQQVVEIILQNNRAGAFGGEYNSSSPLTSARNFREQHAFHMHGARRASPCRGISRATTCMLSGSSMVWHLSNPSAGPARAGGHFYVVGMGLGVWSEANVSSYNLVNPPLRDTATVMFDTDGPAGGWLALRFKANNPGALGVY